MFVVVLTQLKDNTLIKFLAHVILNETTEITLGAQIIKEAEGLGVVTGCPRLLELIT